MKHFFFALLVLFITGIMMVPYEKKMWKKDQDFFWKQETFSFLARIFHADRDEESAKPGVASQNVNLTQHPSVFPDSAVDQHEISGLGESGCVALLVGLRAPLATWLWLKVEACWEGEQWKEMHQWIEIILQLQPYNIPYYSMAAWELAWNAASGVSNEAEVSFYINAGRRVLEQGILKNPESALLYESLGVLLRDRLQDHEAAAAAFIKAATLPGAHAYLRRFAIYELAASGHRDLEACEDLQKLYEEKERERVPVLLDLKKYLEMQKK